MNAQKCMPILKLQGDIKMLMMKEGVSQSLAHDLAGEIVEVIMASDVATDELKKSFKEE